MYNIRCIQHNIDPFFWFLRLSYSKVSLIYPSAQIFQIIVSSYIHKNKTKLNPIIYFILLCHCFLFLSFIIFLLWFIIVYKTVPGSSSRNASPAIPRRRSTSVERKDTRRGHTPPSPPTDRGYQQRGGRNSRRNSPELQHRGQQR